ncbi:acetyl-CoA hydrolase/transferase family protein [Bifidobacterium saguinibicoloris]|uniref:acetyl-CoA hydrolase/transferase family protein n=1 Tax=Bifidobacterium saguinibicoloris TaxID=2834433 RepID=UPI001C59221F|nr:acetyl-CoA hydrolase/transferase C-terminal domain-containing protein [Bifidobacterium saguinibicoloris]MBW3080446.1 hypothetical protein [Bifidobacterium saguinibicoloris]
MTSYEAEYAHKHVAVEEVLRTIKDHNVLYTGIKEPPGFLRKLHTIGDDVKDVTLLHCQFAHSYPFLETDRYKGHIQARTTFTDFPSIRIHDAKITDFVPANVHNGYGRDEKAEHIDLYVALVSAMDEHGYFHLVAGGFEREAMAHADKVVVEVNPTLPRTLGYTEIHISEVDFITEDTTPVDMIPEQTPDEADISIGRNVASLIHDGDTIQLGVGKIPDTAAHFLGDKNDLGVHTEVVTTAIAQLAKDGVITGRRKTFLPRKIVATSVVGTQELFEFVDENPAVWIMPGSFTNDPHIIAKNDNMISVNSAIEVDLTGQVCSESIGTLQYSGSGGAADFAIGANHSRGGKSIIAIKSTAKHGTVSKIKSILTPGSIVTVGRNEIDYVVTEYGIAKLKGKSVADRVRELIAIAHPDFRDELAAQAEEYKLW